MLMPCVWLTSHEAVPAADGQRGVNGAPSTRVGGAATCMPAISCDVAAGAQLFSEVWHNRAHFHVAQQPFATPVTWLIPACASRRSSCSWLTSLLCEALLSKHSILRV